MADQDLEAPALLQLLAEVRPTVNWAVNEPGASPWQIEIRTGLLARIDGALAKARAAGLLEAP